MNEKSKRIWEVIICPKDQIEKNLPIIKRKLSKKLPLTREFAFGIRLFSVSDKISIFLF